MRVGFVVAIEAFALRPIPLGPLNRKLRQVWTGQRLDMAVITVFMIRQRIRPHNFIQMPDPAAVEVVQQPSIVRLIEILVRIRFLETNAV